MGLVHGPVQTGQSAWNHAASTVFITAQDTLGNYYDCCLTLQPVVVS